MGLFRDIKDDLANRYYNHGIDGFLARTPNPRSPIRVREYGSPNMTAQVWTETLYRETARASADSQTSPAHRIKGLVSDEIHELDESNWEAKWEASSGHDIVDEYLYEKGLDPRNDPWLAFRRLSGERVATDLFNRGGWEVPKAVGHEAGFETNPVRQKFNQWVTSFNNNVVLPYFDAVPDLESRLIVSSRSYRDNRSAARISAGLQGGSMLDRHGDAVLAMIKESGEKGVSLDIGIFQFESPVILNALLEREGGFKNVRMTTNRFNKNAATGEASISQLEHLMNRTLNFLRSSGAFGDEYKFTGYNDPDKDYKDYGFNPSAPHFSHNVMAHYKIAVMGVRDKTGKLISKIDNSNRNTMKMVIGSANWTQSAIGRMVNRGGDPIDVQGFNIEHGFFLHAGMIGRELDQNVFDELMYQSGRAMDWVHERKLDSDVGEDFRDPLSIGIESKILTNTGIVNQQQRLLKRLASEGGKGVIMANLLGDMSSADSTSIFLQRLVDTIVESQGNATFKILIGANPTASGTTINTSNRALILKYQQQLAKINSAYANNLQFTQVQTQMVHGKSMMFEIGDNKEHYGIIGSTNFDNSMMQGQYSGKHGTGTAPILNLGILVSGKEFKTLDQQLADMEKLHKVYGLYGFLQAGVKSPWENWESVGWDKLANKYSIDKRLISKGGLVQTGFDAKGMPTYQAASAKLSIGGRFNVRVGEESLGIDVGNLYSLTVAAHEKGFEGTLYVQELGKFIGPVKGILTAKTQEELDSFGKEGKPQDFSPEEVLVAGISAAQQRIQYELQAMAETIGAKALQTMMSDPFFKGYFRRTAKTIIREQFQNFQGFEPGKAAFDAKSHARLAFSMDRPGHLDLWDQLMVDVRKIEESLLPNPVASNRLARKIKLNAWRMMFMGGSLSSFNKSGQPSPGLFYEMEALNTMPFTSMLYREGNKDDEGKDRPEFFMLLPGAKLEQLPQRLQNAMSTRVLTPANELIDAKDLNKTGISRFRSSNKANERGIIFRGYALGGFPGDNAYLVAEQFRGIHVADESYHLNVKFSNAMLVKTSTGLIMRETLDTMYAKDATLGRVLSDGRYYISSAGLRALNHQLPVAESYIEGTQLIQRQFASLGTEKWANSVSTLNEDVGLILDMDNMRIVRGSGTDTLSVNGVMTRDIISGDRLMYPIKAPGAGIQGDSRMVTTITDISRRTNQNVHKAFGLNQANIFFGSGNIKTGDLFIQTGIHTLTSNNLYKNQIHQLREAAEQISSNRTASGIQNKEGLFLKKSFEGSRALFSKLDVFIDKKLSKDVKELLDFDLNEIFDKDGNIHNVTRLNQLLDKSKKLLDKSSRYLLKDSTRQISISKTPHHVAAAALAFSLHAASSLYNLQHSNLDAEVLTKIFRYKPGTTKGIAGERDGATYMEQQILNFVPIYGVSNFSASAVPMSSRDRVSFLNYHLGNYTDAFMDMFALSDRVKDRQSAYTELVLGGMLRAGGTKEVSYAGEEFNVMTRYIQGFDAYDDPVTGKRVQQGVEITLNGETKTVGVFERELQISRELQGHGSYYTREVKDKETGSIRKELVYLQEGATALPGLQRADVVRDKDLIKARIGSLKEEFNAIEEALRKNLKEPGRVVSNINGSVSSAAIIQFNSIQERAGVSSRTMLVNRIGYLENGDFKFDAAASGKDARLQTVQIKFLSPKTLKSLGAFEDYSHEILRLQYQIERSMGVLEKIRSVTGSDGSSRVVNLMTQQEQSTYVQMMQMIGDLANYQKLAAGTDLQKILGGELQISGRNMIVGTLPELERGVMVIGDEMWEFMKKGAKEEMMSALRRSVSKRRKEMIEKYKTVENIPMNQRVSVKSEIVNFLRGIKADKSYFEKADLMSNSIGLPFPSEQELSPEEIAEQQKMIKRLSLGNAKNVYHGPVRRLVRLRPKLRSALFGKIPSDDYLKLSAVNEQIQHELSLVFGEAETLIHASFLNDNKDVVNFMFETVENAKNARFSANLKQLQEKTLGKEGLYGRGIAELEKTLAETTQFKREVLETRKTTIEINKQIRELQQRRSGAKARLTTFNDRVQKFSEALSGVTDVILERINKNEKYSSLFQKEVKEEKVLIDETAISIDDYIHLENEERAEHQKNILQKRLEEARKKRLEKAQGTSGLDASTGEKLNAETQRLLKKEYQAERNKVFSINKKLRSALNDSRSKIQKEIKDLGKEISTLRDSLPFRVAERLSAQIDKLKHEIYDSSDKYLTGEKTVVLENIRSLENQIIKLEKAAEAAIPDLLKRKKELLALSDSDSVRKELQTSIRNLELEFDPRLLELRDRLQVQRNWISDFNERSKTRSAAGMTDADTLKKELEKEIKALELEVIRKRAGRERLKKEAKEKEMAALSVISAKKAELSAWELSPRRINAEEARNLLNEKRQARLAELEAQLERHLKVQGAVESSFSGVKEIVVPKVLREKSRSAFSREYLNAKHRLDVLNGKVPGRSQKFSEKEKEKIVKQFLLAEDKEIGRIEKVRSLRGRLSASNFYSLNVPSSGFAVLVPNRLSYARTVRNAFSYNDDPTGKTEGYIDNEIKSLKNEIRSLRKEGQSYIKEEQRQFRKQLTEEVKEAFELKAFLNFDGSAEDLNAITEALLKTFDAETVNYLLMARSSILSRKEAYESSLKALSEGKQKYAETHLSALLKEKARLELSGKLTSAESYDAAEQLFDDILEDSRYRDQFLRGAFQRAGSPMGPLGIVINKILKVSEYNEYQTKEYGDVSIKLDAQMNRRAVFVNMGAMMFNLGDFDGDTASIAQLRKFAELNTLSMMNASALQNYEREILNRARTKLGYSAEELVIEHVRGYSGWTELFSEQEMYIGSEKEYKAMHSITNSLDAMSTRITQAQTLFHNIALTAEELRKTNLSGNTSISVEEIRNQRLMQVEKGNALYRALQGKNFTEAQLSAYMDFRKNITRMHDIAIAANRYVDDQYALTKDFNEYFLRYGKGKSKEEAYKQYFESGYFRESARDALQKSFKTFTGAAGGTNEKLDWNVLFGFFVQTNYAANLLIGKTFNIEIATITAMKRDSSTERNMLAKQAQRVLGLSADSLKYTDSRQVLDILEAYRLATDNSIQVNPSLQESSKAILASRGISTQLDVARLSQAKEILEKQKGIAERELKISGVVLAVQQIAREAIKPPSSYRSLLEQFKGLSGLVGASESELAISAVKGLLNDTRVKGIAALYELTTGRSIEDSRTQIDFERKTEDDWKKYHEDIKASLYEYYSTQIQSMYAQGTTRDKARVTQGVGGGPPVFESEAVAEEAFRNAEALFKGSTKPSTFSGSAAEKEILRSMGGFIGDKNDSRGYREKTIEEIQREVYQYAELAREQANAQTLTKEHYEQGTLMYYARQKADESARLITNAHLDAAAIYEGEYLYKRALAGDGTSGWKEAISQVDARTKLSIIFQMSSRSEISAEGGIGRALIDVFQHFTSGDELFEVAKEASDSRDYANQLKALYDGFNSSSNMNLAIARAAKASGMYREEQYKATHDESIKTLEAQRDALKVGTPERDHVQTKIDDLQSKYEAEKEIREDSRTLLAEMVKSAGGGEHMGFSADRLSTSKTKSSGDVFFEKVETGIGKAMRSTAVTGATANAIVPALVNTLLGGVSGAAGERFGSSLIEFGGIALAYANPATMLRDTFKQSKEGEGITAAVARTASMAAAFGVGAGLGHLAGRATFAHLQALPSMANKGKAAGLLTLLASATAGFAGGTAIGMASESLLMRLGVVKSHGPQASPTFRGEAGDPEEHVDLSELGFELVEGGEGGGGHSEIVTLTTEAGETIVQEFWVESVAARDSAGSSDDSSQIEADLDTVVSMSSFETHDFSKESSVLDYK